jgi:ribosomal protein L7Ae-like RNA K-turn-binding protein
VYDPEARVLGMIGLARRAGRAVIGSDAVKEAARQGHLAAVVVATDAGPNARKRVVPLLVALGVPIVECGDRGSLGRSVGRAPVATVGIRDARLATRIMAGLDIEGKNAQEDRR